MKRTLPPERSHNHPRNPCAEGLLSEWEVLAEAERKNRLFNNLTVMIRNTEGSRETASRNRRRLSLSCEEFERRCSENELLIIEARPYLEQISLGFYDTPHFVALSDAEGWILTRMGSAGSMENGRTSGSSRPESVIGGDGIWTALEKGGPVFICGTEQYDGAAGPWGSLGIPVRNVYGRIIGALEVSVPAEYAHPYRLAPLLAVAGSLERAVALKESRSQAHPEKEQVDLPRLAFEAGNIGVWRHDLETGIIRFDDRARLHYGFPTPEVTLAEVLARVHPDDVARLAAEMKRVLDPADGMERFDTEYRVIHPDGRIYWLQISVRVHFTGSGETRKPEYGYGTTQDITSRKDSEERLRSSERTLNTVLESIPVGVIITDPDGRVLRSNEAMRTIWGAIPSTDSWEKYGEWVGYWPETGKRLAADEWTMARALREGRSIAGDLIEFERFDTGERRFLLNNAAPIRDSSGTIIAGVVVELDVTDRLKAERDLHESEARFRALVTASADGVYRMSPDWSVLIRLDGKGFLQDVSEPTTSWFEQYIVADDWEKVKAAVADSIRRKGVFELEHRAVKKDGSIGWVLSRAVPIIDLHGEVIEWFGTASDISARKQAEEDLSHQLLLFETVIRNSPAAINIMRAEDLRIILVNDAYRLFAPGKSVEGKTLEEAWPETGYAFSALCGKVLETGVPYHAEDERFTIRRFSDSPLEEAFFSWWIIPDKDRKWLVNIAFETTERHRSEELLRNAMLQAEAANRSKSEFLAHMSHEIRTPISGILGMLDLVTPRIKDLELGQYLSLARESAESLLSVIGDVLDLSRIESGVVELELREWDVRKYLSSVFTPLRMLAEQKGLRFSIRIEENVPECVKTDGEKIAQIIRNLVSNAVKYTDRGRVTVTLTAEPLTVNRLRFRFTVSDTGIGIPSEKQDAIFESFVRLRKAVTERNTEGTGLGLTITKRLVDMMGGSIGVESTPGKGSTFTFTVEVEPVEKAVPRAAESRQTTLDELPPLSILVVEDNRINRMFIEVRLRDAGHHVTVAENGEESLAAILARGDTLFDLVLMDVQMPVMDGIEATRHIRSLPGPVSGVPIIALTAFAMKDDEDRFRDAGMDAYVTKPVDWNALAGVIKGLNS